MTATTLTSAAASRPAPHHNAPHRDANNGILKLPASLRRDLIVLVALKLAALSLLYFLCFSPSHRPTIDAVAHIAGQRLDQ
jgi:hypothetical protein